MHSGSTEHSWLSVGKVFVVVEISITGMFIFCCIFFETCLKMSVSLGFFKWRKSSSAKRTFAETFRSFDAMYFSVLILTSGSRNSLFLKKLSLLEPSESKLLLCLPWKEGSRLEATEFLSSSMAISGGRGNFIGFFWNSAIMRFSFCSLLADVFEYGVDNGTEWVFDCASTCCDLTWLSVSLADLLYADDTESGHRYTC